MNLQRNLHSTADNHSIPLERWETSDQTAVRLCTTYDRGWSAICESHCHRRRQAVMSLQPHCALVSSLLRSRAHQRGVPRCRDEAWVHQQPHGVHLQWPHGYPSTPRRRREQSVQVTPLAPHPLASHLLQCTHAGAPVDANLKSSVLTATFFFAWGHSMVPHEEPRWREGGRRDVR